MKVIITRPKYYTHLVTPPLGMAYVCAYLKHAGLNASIIDGLKENIDNQRLVLRCNDADVVGIFCMSDFFWDVLDLTKRLKNEGKIVVIGGPQATVMPLKTLEYTLADYAVVGEGEETMRQLVYALKEDRNPVNIPGVYSKNTKELIARDFFED